MFLAGVTNSVFFPLPWVLNVSIKVVLQKCECGLSVESLFSGFLFTEIHDAQFM